MADVAAPDPSAGPDPNSIAGKLAILSGQMRYDAPAVADAAPAMTAPSSPVQAGAPSAGDLQSMAAQHPQEYQPSPDEAAQMADDLKQIAARQSQPDQSQAPPPDFNSLDGKLAILNGTARYSPPTSPAQAGKLTGPVANFGGGANDVIAGTLGAPVDAVAAAMRDPNAPPIPDSFRQSHPEAAAFLDTWRSALNNPIGGSDFIKQKILGSVGANPDNVAPADSLDRFARAVGGGTAAMLTPIPGSVAKSLPEMAGNLVAGATGGGTGALAASAVTAPYKPFASTAGNLAGGGIVATTEAGLAALKRGATDLANRFIAPLTASGKQGIAAQRLQGAATNPGLVVQALEDQANRAPIVPGSNPTTGQLTGDPGLLALERVQATKNPDLFNARRGEQQEAQTSALNNVQPTGDPAALGQFVRNQLDAIDSRYAGSVAEAQRTAQDSNSALGGRGTVQGYGSSIRDSLASAKQAARDRESALWDAIDPDKTLAIDATPAKAVANDIGKNLGEYAKPPQGEEAAVLGKMQDAPQVMKFSDLTDLRGRLLSAIRDERQASGSTPALARMQQLRQALDDTIATGAERVAQREAQEVAAGRMRADDTMAARFAAKTERWYADRNAATAEAGTGRDIGANSGGYAGSGLAAVPGLGRAGVSPRGRSGSAAGDQSLSGGAGEESLAPNFDADAAGRYRAAADATRNRVETFGTGAAGQVLRPGPTAGSYRLADSAVPAKFLNKGKTSAEDIQSFIKAAGGRPEALETLHDYAAYDLRRAASRPDGSLDPRKVNIWLGQHRDALNAFPELKQQFKTAATAEQAVMDAEGARATALKQQQGYAAQRFIGSDPVKAFQAALGSRNPAAEMTKLARWASLDRTGQALEGLRRTAVEYMTGKFITESTGNPSIKAQQFQNFINDNRAALGAIFPPERMKNLEDIAADLRRTNPMRAKLAGSPGTAADLTGVARHAGASGEGHDDNLISYLVALGLEHHSGSFLTSLGGALGVKVMNALRAHGMQTADDIVTEALLNPRFAQTLMVRTTSQTRPSILDRLTRELTMVGGSAAVQQFQATQPQPRPAVPPPVAMLVPVTPPVQLEDRRAALARGLGAAAQSARLRRFAASSKPAKITA